MLMIINGLKCRGVFPDSSPSFFFVGQGPFTPGINWKWSRSPSLNLKRKQEIGCAKMNALIYVLKYNKKTNVPYRFWSWETLVVGSGGGGGQTFGLIRFWNIISVVIFGFIPQAFPQHSRYEQVESLSRWATMNALPHNII
ncbi:hypothetical protein BLOT_014626 [Blomia tropicalis]|nr:hypothetical protein BLOT_014626 [Blomia tropicalis]